MVFQTTSSVIMAHTLYLNFRSIYSQCSMSPANSPSVIISKLMVEHSIQIKHLSSILDASSTRWLPWADIAYFVGFSYNNSINSSTRVTPFYAYTGYHPRWCLVEPLELPTNPSAQDHLGQLQQIQTQLSNHLREAQLRYQSNADRHRLPSTFQVGDQI